MSRLVSVRLPAPEGQPLLLGLGADAEAGRTHVEARHAVAEAARAFGDHVGAEVEGFGLGVASPKWSGIVGRLYVEPGDAANGHT